MNVTEVEYPGFGVFKMFVTNSTLEYRAKTFLTKEPTTIDWIKGLESDAVLIDIGANVGIYTLPSALFHVKKVISFEPEIRNYNMLLNNLDINNLGSDKVEALPLAISTKHANASAKIYLTIDQVGASCHQVGESQNHLLQSIDCSQKKSRSVYCISLASVVDNVNQYHDGPIHIKIDVDGIEDDVCQSLFDEKLITRVSSFQIELNPNLNAHANLIKKLDAVGFYFSKEQVKRSERKTGDFKGFAEYVFKRAIPPEVLRLLPKECANHLGSNYVPISNSSKKMPQSGFFNLNASFPVPLSRFPCSFALKNSFNHFNTASLFHEVSINVMRENARGFDYAKADGANCGVNELRHSIDNSAINNVSQSYFSELILQLSSPQFFEKIKYIVDSGLKLYFDAKSLRAGRQNIRHKAVLDSHIVCRVRHFVDLRGYALSKHHDSDDTYCALVVPLIPFSTATSIVGGGVFDRSFAGSQSNKGLMPSGFADLMFAANSELSTYVEYSVDSNGQPFKQSIPFSLSEAPLNPGEIFVIPNLNCPINSSSGANLNSDSSLKMLMNSGHGVLPMVYEPYRPVLLIDYVLGDPKRIKSVQLDTSVYIDHGDVRSLMFD